jgi:hypothetical protein
MRNLSQALDTHIETSILDCFYNLVDSVFALENDSAAIRQQIDVN